jgi:hypothetical protein
VHRQAAQTRARTMALDSLVDDEFGINHPKLTVTEEALVFKTVNHLTGIHPVHTKKIYLSIA